MSYIRKINYHNIQAECEGVIGNIEDRIAELENLMNELSRIGQSQNSLDVAELLNKIQKHIRQWQNDIDDFEDDLYNGVEVDSDYNQPEYTYNGMKNTIYGLRKNVNQSAADYRRAIRSMMKAIQENRRRENIAKAEAQTAQFMAEQQRIREENRAARAERDKQWRLRHAQQQQQAASAQVLTEEEHRNLIEQSIRHRREESARRQAEFEMAQAKAEETLAILKQKHLAETNAQQNKSLSEIDEINDPIMRQFASIALHSNPSLSGKDLIEMAKQMKINAERQVQAEELQIARAQAETVMRKSQMDEQQIANALSVEGTEEEQINKLNEIADNVLVDENIRKKSVAIILKAIQARNFVVIGKPVMHKSENYVEITAKKVTGEMAIFKVYLDGRFIYDFNHYEGQACQKDITPFMDDLERVYGMNIDEVKDIYGNPDKLNTKKINTMNKGSINS